MEPTADFGNAEFEPSDEELVALSREAFAEVGQQHRAALDRLRAEVRRLRKDALERFPAPGPADRGVFR